MGIFDWLRRKSAPEPPAPSAPETQEAPPKPQPDADEAFQADEALERSPKPDAGKVFEADEALDHAPKPDAGEVFEVDEILERAPAPRLGDMDFTGFWHDTRESERRLISSAPDYRIVREVEAELGVKLPASYKELMRLHNGGMVNRCWFPARRPARSMADYVQITSLLSLGKEAPYSLCGRFGSRFLVESYSHNPEIGVVIANTVKPGRALVFLDYRECGAEGEPRVTYADAETGTEIVLADSFEAFVRGLIEINPLISQTR